MEIPLDALAEKVDAIEHIDQGWAQGLHQLVEAYEDWLHEGLFEDGVQDQTITGQTYCGCQTCGVRELTALVVSQTVEAMKKGLIR